LNFFQGIENLVADTDEPDPSRTLAQQLDLDYAPSSAFFIVTGDGLGSSGPANDAIEAIRQGIATSPTLIVPAPSAQAVAECCSDIDIGVRLPLMSEYPTYRWRSLTGAPSLHDADGRDRRDRVCRISFGFLCDAMRKAAA